MLQNVCKTVGFKKNMVYKIPPVGEVNHVWPTACMCFDVVITFLGKYIPMYLIFSCAKGATYMWQNSILILYINTFRRKYFTKFGIDRGWAWEWLVDVITKAHDWINSAEMNNISAWQWSLWVKCLKWPHHSMQMHAFIGDCRMQY